MRDVTFLCSVLSLLAIGFLLGRYVFPVTAPFLSESFDHVGMHCVAYVHD